jgi:PAS domain S-box-containing protein
VAEALALAHVHSTLAEEQQRLHTILDQLPEGVVLVEAKTSQISYANTAAAQLLGFGLPQLMGTLLNQSALLSPYGHSQQVQQSIFRWNFALIDALWGKTSIGQELLISRPDGSEVVVLSSVAPIRRSQGLISEAVIVFQDITATKQLEQHKETFFAVANHELRTPLTIISGFVEVLQMPETQQNQAMTTYALTSMQEECEHLLHLIQEVLDVSRPDQTRIEVHKTTQELLAPLRQSIAKQIQTTTTHPFDFLLEDLSSADQLLGSFDLARIEQVVRNLITNAVKYSPAGSTIEVGIRPDRNHKSRAHHVVIWVKDQGIGIPPYDLPHIFERFYRASNSSQSASGFGIGLYLTRHLVQAHGGRIWAESTVGKGSTFFVTLPLLEHQQAAS